MKVLETDQHALPGGAQLAQRAAERAISSQDVVLAAGNRPLRLAESTLHEPEDESGEAQSGLPHIASPDRHPAHACVAVEAQLQGVVGVQCLDGAGRAASGVPHHQDQTRLLSLEPRSERARG